jgi:hypothetical protein
VSYIGFADPSGGSSDSFTLAIGHHDLNAQSVILDCVREHKLPFSPEQVVSEYATLLKSYRVHTITSDKYAGSWVTEQFSKFGITCEQSARPKSELYVDLLPLINSARISLIDHPKLVNQLCGLERRTSRSGRDTIDHVLGGHDDLANVLAGIAATNNTFGYTLAGFQPDANDGDDQTDAYRERRQAVVDVWLGAIGRLQ